LSKVDFSTTNSRELFRSGTVNKYTLKFFKYLQVKFSNMDFSGHIDAVREYLYSSMEHKDADELLGLYKTYLEYENKVASELNNAGELKTTEDLLKVLKKMKLLQYELFGKDNAEIIFGAMMKAQEYPIRRGGIVNDSSLYASEKEEHLQKLNTDMWGTEGDRIEKSRKPYVAYTETLSIYSKDMSDMNDKDKQAKIEEIRKSIFPPDVVQRLEEVDSRIETEKERDAQYQKDYALIINRNDISADEKKNQNSGTSG
jgi:lipase chaperone LimK